MRYSIFKILVGGAKYVGLSTSKSYVHRDKIEFSEDRHLEDIRTGKLLFRLLLKLHQCFYFCS